jgi:hypothetical protein
MVVFHLFAFIFLTTSVHVPCVNARHLSLRGKANHRNLMSMPNLAVDSRFQNWMMATKTSTMTNENNNNDPVVCMCITEPCDCTTGSTDSLLDESTLTECPVTGANAICTMEYYPMTCGDLGCEYGNECAAANAGWNTQVQCQHNDAIDTTLCPMPEDFVMCTAMYQPVVCGNGDDIVGCLYGSPCIAMVAGWMEGECVPDNSTILVDPIFETPMCKCNEDQPDCCDSIMVNETFICPTTFATCESSSNSSNSTNIDSYFCGPNWCWFPGECEATSAGYNVSSECEVVPTCAMSDPQVACDEVQLQDVVCGDLGCWYPSLCYASAANWKEADCVAVNYSFGVIDPITYCSCPMDDPDCCNIDVNDTSSTDACPVSDPAVRCASSPMAYQCGEAACYYESECLATTAGWDVDQDCVVMYVDIGFGNETETDNSTDASTGMYEYDSNGCPITSSTWSCYEMYSPVQCTLDKEDSPVCEYANDCLAQGAGWNMDPEALECQSLELAMEPEKDCPVPGRDVACTLDYNPMVCSRGSWEGCEYDNACMAKAAGFNVKKHCEEV